MVALFASAEQRETLAKVQALMSLLEGHGNAVMNRLGAELVDGQERMARVLQARRNARGATALLHRLLGLELKMRQYELGEAFVNAIEREAGLHAVDPAWQRPRASCRRSPSSPTRDLARPRRRGHRRRPVAPGHRRAVAGPARRSISTGSSPRSSSRAPAAPTRSRLLVLAADARPRAGRGARRPRPAARTARATPTSSRDAAARLGVTVALRRGGRRRRAGTSKRGRATRATPRSSPCAPSSAPPRSSSRTPRTTRPRPCCSTCCAGAARAVSPGCPHGAAIVVRPLLGVAPGRRPRAVRRAGFAPVDDPSNEDRVHRRNWVRLDALPALSDGARSAISCPCSPARPRCCGPKRTSSTSWLTHFLTEAGGDEPRRACSPTRIPRWPVEPSGAGSARPPPSLAEVERVLAVARCERRAAELSRGRRVWREDGPSAPGSTVTPVTDPLGASRGARPRSSSERILGLGKEITADYAGRPPLLVGVLKGAFMFMSDLARAIDLPVEFDFMAVSSYGSATRTSGVVRIIKDLDLDLTDRHVLIVEDIVDSGLTLAYLRRNLEARQPGVARDLRAAGEGRPAEVRPRHQVRRLPDPARLRRRLRPRRRRAATATCPTSSSTPGPPGRPLGPPVRIAGPRNPG